MGVPSALVRALAKQGLDTAFPIQAATLGDTLNGRDVLGRGRTGSGKTLAFSIPMAANLTGRHARPNQPLGLIL
ncbi:MAG TPA: DEAD/DEAH box helicase, partial [Ruania sp.]|nr:DEAD/DEAH box helicase [Ruania sp.]